MYKRRRYLVKKGLQFRYIGTILLAVFIIAATCIVSTYYSLLILLGEKLANVYPQGRLVSILKDVNLIVLYRVLILVPFVMIIGLFLSHKIAGPLFRMEKVLRDIGKGNFDIHVKLRKGDELKGMAEAINDMTANLKDMKTSYEKKIRELSNK